LLNNYLAAQMPIRSAASGQPDTLPCQKTIQPADLKKHISLEIIFYLCYNNDKPLMTKKGRKYALTQRICCGYSGPVSPSEDINAQTAFCVFVSVNLLYF